jgi:hypothetical protein
VISVASDKTFSLFAMDMDRDWDMDLLSSLAGTKTIAWYETLAVENRVSE